MNSRITFIIMLTLLLHQGQAVPTLRIIIDRMQVMEADKESKIQGAELHIAPSNNSFFQGEFQVVEDLVSNKLKLNVEVYRCLVKEAPDTCEYLINLKPPTACMLINAENTAWNAVTDAFTPKLRCPFTKGKYVADKITFDVSKWTIFPLDSLYFKLSYKLYEGDVLTLAIIAECHSVRVL